jgi:hypothetical protein
VHYQLVDRHRGGDLRGQVDAADPGHAGPGRVVLPAGRQPGQPAGYPRPPVSAQPGPVGGRRLPAGVQVLGRRRGKGQAEPVDVVEQVGHRHAAARRRRAQLGIADTGDHFGERPGGGRQVQVHVFLLNAAAGYPARRLMASLLLERFRRVKLIGAAPHRRDPLALRTETCRDPV